LTFDWPTILRQTAEHLVDMSHWPGFQDHAKWRRDEMLADPVWYGLREEILRVLAERKARSTGT
jgi:hypothetical protein